MIKDRIKQMLQKRKKTEYWLGKETGISKGTMWAYIEGKSIPGAINLIKIADALDCSIDYLVGRTDNPEVNR